MCLHFYLITYLIIIFSVFAPCCETARAIQIPLSRLKDSFPLILLDKKSLPSNLNISTRESNFTLDTTSLLSMV